MRRNKGNTVPVLDTGKTIRGVIKQQNLTKAQVARRLGRKQSTVTLLTKKTSLQAYIIWEFGRALNHNFFADLAQLFDETATGAGITSPQARIAELEKENSELKLQVKTLEKAIELMGRK